MLNGISEPFAWASIQKFEFISLMLNVFNSVFARDGYKISANKLANDTSNLDYG